jgi:Kef-type K+ transport system membrane component KefB
MHDLLCLSASFILITIVNIMRKSMNRMMSFLIQILVMLSIARIFGGFARQLHQPSVLGEILGGIILGPTVFGALAPELQTEVFLLSGDAFHLLNAIAQLGLIAFVFIAGMEVDLDCIRGREKGAISTSICGIVLPFALGYAMVILIPDLWSISIEDRQLFALFMGVALSIAALPVIARILMDLDLMRSELGGIIMVAATINDIFGWSIFALILASLKANINPGMDLILTVGMLAVAFGILYLIRRKGDNPVEPPWGGIIDLIALAMLTASLASQLTGGHGIVAAFLAGLILSERRSQKDSILKLIYLPVMTIMTPIYFVSLGLRTDFAVDFDAIIVLLIFVVACAGKIIGASLGAMTAGIKDRKALAVGFGLNARGAMEIALASAALHYGLIEGHIFVALVIMALATTVISSIGLPWLLNTHPVSAKAWEPLPLHEQAGSYNYLDS